MFWQEKVIIIGTLKRVKTFGHFRHMVVLKCIKDALKRQSDTLKRRLNMLEVKTHLNVFHLNTPFPKWGHISKTIFHGHLLCSMPPHQLFPPNFLSNHWINALEFLSTLQRHSTLKITLEWPLNLTTYAIGLFQKKSTPMLENLTGWGVNGFGNPDGRGALNLRLHPRG